MSGSIFTPRYGVKMTATNQEAISAKPTIQKMLPAYSPALDQAKPTGVKPMIVISVPESMRRRGSRHRRRPWCARKPSSFTTIISMAMMASSTRSPREMMISAPSVIRSNARPVSSMMTKTTASVSGTAAATTMPTRQPRLTRLTTMTTPRATKNLSMNSSTASRY